LIFADFSYFAPAKIKPGIMQNRIYTIFFILSVFLLNSCKEKPINRAMVVAQLKSSAELSTTEFVVSKVIMAKKQKSFMSINLGKEATFMSRTKAYIKAGIDLSKLKPEDLKIENTSISIELPAVEITNFSYPAEDFETIDKYSDEGFWNRFSVDNKDFIFRQGESAIRESLPDLHLDKTTEANTRVFFDKLLKNMGFTEVYIQFKETKN
jgi:hypothetical protein